MKRAVCTHTDLGSCDSSALPGDYTPLRPDECAVCEAVVSDLFGLVRFSRERPITAKNDNYFRLVGLMGNICEELPMRHSIMLQQRDSVHEMCQVAAALGAERTRPAEHTSRASRPVSPAPRCACARPSRQPLRCGGAPLERVGVSRRRTSGRTTSRPCTSSRCSAPSASPARSARRPSTSARTTRRLRSFSATIPAQFSRTRCEDAAWPCAVVARCYLLCAARRDRLAYLWRLARSRSASTAWRGGG